jgi:hypothetical protein
VARPSFSYAKGQVNDLALWWRWGDSNSGPPHQALPGSGCVVRLTCIPCYRW